jgi:hypothetical protein
MAAVLMLTIIFLKGTQQSTAFLPYFIGLKLLFISFITNFE